MKTLVTGANGFLGSWIVKLLQEEGHEVSVLIRRESPELQKAGVKTIIGDLSDETLVSQSLVDIECVYHVAARAGIWGSFQDYFRDNVLSTRNIIKGCKSNAVPRLVFTSSPSVVIGSKELEGANEDTPYADHFLAHYPSTKAIAEQEVLEANSEKLMTCALRPHLIWGPGDRHLIPRFLLRGKQRRLRIVGSGQNKVDTIYVEDAARAHLLACEKLTPGSLVCGKVFFLSQDEPVVLFDWINRILEAAEIEPVKKRIPKSMAYSIGYLLEKVYALVGASAEPPMTRFVARQLSQSHYFDHSRAKNILGFQPQYTMEEAFQKTFESQYFKELCKS